MATRLEQYNQYIHSTEWKNRRLTHLSVHPVCVICGTKRRLHVHHLTYANFRNENSEDLLTLCQVCHEETHRLVDQGYPLATAHLSVTVAPVPPKTVLAPRVTTAPKRRRAARTSIRHRTTRNNHALALAHLRATGLRLDAASLIKAVGGSAQDRRRLKNALKRDHLAGKVQRKGHLFFV